MNFTGLWYVSLLAMGDGHEDDDQFCAWLSCATGTTKHCFLRILLPTDTSFESFAGSEAVVHQNAHVVADEENRLLYFECRIIRLQNLSPYIFRSFLFYLCSSNNSSYPLGGSVSAALILSVSAALATTMYATASCRFVVITFTSDAGGLEDSYSGGSRAGATDAVTYKAAVGLYQWLRPKDPIDWSEGSCAGYQQTMLAQISDTYFNVSRSFAVFAVLMALFMTAWIFLTSCLDMNRIQRYLFAVICFVGMVSTAMTFFFRKSALCETEFLTRDCTIDQGGLVMIAAVLFWLVTFFIAVRFVVCSGNTHTADVDFQRQDERDKAKIAAKARRRVASSPKDTTLQQSYSFDSQYSWTRPVPSRSATAAADASQSAQQQKEQRSSKQQRAAGAVKEYPPRQQAPSTTDNPVNDKIAESSLTIDHTSDTHAMEVYIAQRLNCIEKLADV
jgi:hypothetical protein